MRTPRTLPKVLDPGEVNVLLGALRRWRDRAMVEAMVRKLTSWRKVVADLGLDGVRFHDLRHSGTTRAARSGASTRDLMARMGHDSVRAAIIYQHATTEADARIARALEEALTGDRPADTGRSRGR